MNKKPAQNLQKHIPNVFTFFRLLATPLTYYFITQSKYTLAFACFAAAGVSDWVDGYLARRWNVQSKFGRFFDPIADKILMLMSFLTLCYLDKLPLWLVVIVIGRDFLILLSGLISFALKLPIHFSPIKSSKLNTFFQIILIGIILASQTSCYRFYLPNLIQNWFVFLLIYVTGLTTIWSGIEYTLYFIKQLYLIYYRGLDEKK